MITPEIKDEILGQFISSGMRFTINLKMHCHNFNITFDEFDAILRQFEKLNLLKAQTPFLFLILTRFIGI